MPLIDVTIPFKPTLVIPKDAENYDVLQAAMRELKAQRMLRDIKTIDDGVQDAITKANANNRLVFTKTGILLGYGSDVPHRLVNHVWESADLVFPSHLPGNRTDQHAEELQLKFCGGLLRWRISLQSDIWLVYRRDTGKYNQFTGKEIKVSEYWVDNNFVFTPPPKKRGFTINELQSQWGRVSA